MIRKEMYKLLVKELMKIEEIQHVDLWNHNVEFIEDETVWARPAVFVEFATILYTPIAHGSEYRVNDLIVRLHVVTDWKGAYSVDTGFNEEALEVFDLCEKIHKQLLTVKSDVFKELDRVESMTNHNHEDIIDNIEEYHCVGIKSL